MHLGWPQSEAPTSAGEVSLGVGGLWWLRFSKMKGSWMSRTEVRMVMVIG